MNLLQKTLANVIIIILLVLGLLTGCSSNDESSKAKEQEQKPVAGIEIDTSSVDISGEGLELIGVEIEENGSLLNLVGYIKNNSTNKYDVIHFGVKMYDSSGALVDNRGDTARNIEPGEVWKTKILFTNKDTPIAKIKVTEVRTTGSYTKSGGSTKTKKLEDVVVNCAKTLVYKKLKAPGTAQWVSSEILDQDQYGRYLVDVVVDAQNEFGALIRGGFIVVLQSVKEDGNFTHQTMYALHDYKKDYERDKSIDLMKKMNDWNEPKSDSGSSKSATAKGSSQETLASAIQNEWIYQDNEGIYIMTITSNEINVGIWRSEQISQDNYKILNTDNTENKLTILLNNQNKETLLLKDSGKNLQYTTSNGYVSNWTRKDIWLQTNSLP